jgi:hypothetical protein
MRVCLHRAEIVDAHHFDVSAPGFRNGAQDIAADAAKPIDGDTNGHVSALSKLVTPRIGRSIENNNRAS